MLCCLAQAESAKGEANVWTALPSVLWAALIVVALIYLLKPVRELLQHLLLRVRAGAGVKIGSVEIGAVKTAQHHQAVAVARECLSEEEARKAGMPTPEAVQLSQARENFLQMNRKVMLVHRLFRSTKPGQVYDVLIYLVPYGDGNLAQVTGVEYFFGQYWGNAVFESDDRSRGFPVLTSAYGTFLCCARVTFNDGFRWELFRYIDFETGAYAPVLEEPSDSAPNTGPNGKPGGTE
jgi:hypothetical protein